MAKGLYYFKFTPTEWLTGDIVFESFEVQGLFINICALYWQRDGELTLLEIEKRYKKPTALQSLLSGYLTEINGNITIKFLDEQFNERGFISEQNSKNGAKGGRPKTAKPKAIKPTAKRPLSETKQHERQLELEKEVKLELEKEEEQEYNIEILERFPFNDFWDLYDKKVDTKKCQKKYSELHQLDKQIIFERVSDYVNSTPDPKYRKNPLTYLNGKCWEDEIIIAAFKPKTNLENLARIYNDNSLEERYLKEEQDEANNEFR